MTDKAPGWVTVLVWIGLITLSWGAVLAAWWWVQ